jgi:peptidyl-tRNA hydrolase, PTH1 family
LPELRQMFSSSDIQKKWLIAGLGNPGFKYRGTRHNLGYMTVTRLARRFKERFYLSELCLAAKVLKPEYVLYLIKPLTYMNRSGMAVSNFMQLQNLPVEQMLVVFDDLALPAGKIRLKPRGSSGGHNGLASVIDHMGSGSFPRLRIGIGPADTKDVSTFVLSSFKFREKKLISEAVETACDAVEMIITQGLEKAMNIYNQ